MTDHDDTRQWAAERARRLRAQLGTDLASAEIPLYGSRDWHRLPDNDPRRWLALLAAAEAWRHDSDPHTIAARVDVELEAARRADDRDHESWRDVAQRVRHLARVPSHQDLVDRREQPTGDRTVTDSPGWPDVTRPGAWDCWTRTTA